MSYLASLKKNSGNNIEKLSKAIEALAKPKHSDDSDEYWKCAVDKSGNGYAIIRFLPTPEQDVVAGGYPWVKFFDHGFQGPGGWYIEKSLTSLGQDDPCSEYNTQLWQTGLESDKDIVRRQKRREHIVSNIYVVKDAANPANEGKVFKFNYGKKIFEKINQAMNPQFEDDIAIDPFDLWEGANFKLKIRKVDGYQNYDLSEFADPKPLVEDDELEAILKQQYSLLEILNPKNFKTYEELSARLQKALGNSTARHKSAEDFNLNSLAEPKIETKQKPFESKTSNIDEDEDDDDLSYFSNLVGED
jgi:hypothetical protein